MSTTMLEKIWPTKLKFKSIYYDIFESDGTLSWFVGTVRTLGEEDNLITRNDAVKQVRKITKFGYKLHTQLSTFEKYSKFKVI